MEMPCAEGIGDGSWRHACQPARRSADPAPRRRFRLAVRRRRRAVPRPFRDGRAAVLARGEHRPCALRRDPAARRRPGAAGRPGRRPQRHPRRGRRMDAAGLPLEPGRRRHRDRDQSRTGPAHPRPGHGRRGGRARTPAGERDHGVLVRLPAPRPAPHHPADLRGHVVRDPAQLHRAGGRGDGPADEDHPRGHRGPPAAAARPARHRQDLSPAHPGPLLARLVPGRLRARPRAALLRRRLSDGHRDRRGGRHGQGPLAAAAPGGLRRTDPRRGPAHRGPGAVPAAEPHRRPARSGPQRPGGRHHQRGPGAAAPRRGPAGPLSGPYRGRPAHPRRGGELARHRGGRRPGGRHPGGAVRAAPGYRTDLGAGRPHRRGRGSVPVVLS
ncbi:hypothetical protein SGPA1_20080 [Streptomyces misionensis JCM 4497]